MRRVIGRIAGPERPPVIVWMRGLNVSVSIAMPRKVLATVNASAPPSSALRARSVMSVTLGDSFTMTGRRDRAFSILVSSWVSCGLCPKTMPPCFVFGDAIARVELVDNFRIFVFVKTEHIDEYGTTGVSEERHLVADECVDTDIFQADGVQHT